MPQRTLLSLALLATLTTGCGPKFRLPNFTSPGATGPQRHDAIFHDPYPLDDVGPPIEGGRPREYAKPVPQVTRGRLFRG